MNSIKRSDGGDAVKIGGVQYPVLHIGAQIWLGQNLDYKWDGLVIAGGQYTGDPMAIYPDNDETVYGQNGNKYGLLYNWFALDYLEKNKSTLLPAGWSVPENSDFDTLFSFCGGESVAGRKLKSLAGWYENGNGTDDFNFAAVPAGYYFGSSYSITERCVLGTVDAAGGHDFQVKVFVNSSDGASRSLYNKSCRVSVRLIYKGI